MGMIETDIKILESRQEEALEEGYKGFASALGNAIATMRKYQKIEQIVNSKTTRLSYEDGFRQIKEVVKDGNDD